MLVKLTITVPERRVVAPSFLAAVVAAAAAAAVELLTALQEFTGRTFPCRFPLIDFITLAFFV